MESGEHLCVFILIGSKTKDNTESTSGLGLTLFLRNTEQRTSVRGQQDIPLSH